MTVCIRDWGTAARINPTTSKAYAVRLLLIGEEELGRGELSPRPSKLDAVKACEVQSPLLREWPIGQFLATAAAEFPTLSPPICNASLRTNASHALSYNI